MRPQTVERLNERVAANRVVHDRHAATVRERTHARADVIAREHSLDARATVLLDRAIALRGTS